MAYTLMSDTLKVYLKAGETRLSVLLGKDPSNNPSLSRSALQNPDISKYELDCMLRRQEKPAERLAGWAAFFAATPSRCANTNSDIS